MTTYHVDPDVGSNANTGLSWAQAWATLYGLRVQSISLSPGDLIKIAKSPTKTSTLTASGNSYAVDGATANFVTVGNVYSRRFLGTANGAWTASQTFTTFTTSATGPVMASSTGVMDTPSAKLCYKANNAPDMSGFQTILIAAYMTTVYGGSGEQHIPPGTFEIWLCSDSVGDTAVQVIPIDTWILNSTTQRSSYFYQSPSPFPTNISSISIRRTAAALTRDTSLWGITFHNLTVFMAYSMANGLGPDAVWKVMPSTAVKYAPSAIGYVTAANLGVASSSELIDLYIHRCLYPITALPYGNSAIDTARAHLVRDLHLIGSSKQTQAGSTVAAYDLNGFAGGTLASPLVIEGGYDTTSNTVTSQTLFSGASDYNYVYLLDLAGANYVTIRGIQTAHGFISVATNPGTLGIVLSRTVLPALVPPIAGMTTSTNLTLDQCVSSYDGCLFMGAVNNLTLTNTALCLAGYAATNGQAIEVENLTMTNSILHRSGSTNMPLMSPRGNAEVAGALADFQYQWPIAQLTNYGKTLTFRDNDLVTYPNVSTSYFCKTWTTSRWQTILFLRMSGTGIGTWGDGGYGPSMDENIQFTDSTLNPAGVPTSFTTTASIYDNATSWLSTRVRSYKDLPYSPTSLSGIIFSYPRTPNSTNSVYSGSAYGVVKAYLYRGRDITGESNLRRFNRRYSVSSSLTRYAVSVYDSLGYIINLPVNAAKKSSDRVIVVGHTTLTGFVDVDGLNTAYDWYLRQQYMYLPRTMLSAYWVVAGTQYRVRLSIMPNITVTAGTFGDPLNEYYLNNTTNAATKSTHRLALMSLDAMLDIWTFLGTEVCDSVPSGPPYSGWVELAYTFTPTNNGEVILYHLGEGRGASGSSLLDGVLMEVV